MSSTFHQSLFICTMIRVCSFFYTFEARALSSHTFHVQPDILPIDELLRLCCRVSMRSVQSLGWLCEFSYFHRPCFLPYIFCPSWRHLLLWSRSHAQESWESRTPVHPVCPTIAVLQSSPYHALFFAFVENPSIHLTFVSQVSQTTDHQIGMVATYFFSAMNCSDLSWDLLFGLNLSCLLIRDAFFLYPSFQGLFPYASCLKMLLWSQSCTRPHFEVGSDPCWFPLLVDDHFSHS